MKTEWHNRGLRLNAILALLLALVAVSVVTSYIRYLSYRRLLAQTLKAANATDLLAAQIASYIRSRAFLSAGSILVTLVVAYLLLTRLVIDRVEQFRQAVKRLSHGDLDASVTITGNDEFAELANTFNQMAAGLRERVACPRKAQFWPPTSPYDRHHPRPRRRGHSPYRPRLIWVPGPDGSPRNHA